MVKTMPGRKAEAEQNKVAAHGGEEQLVDADVAGSSAASDATTAATDMDVDAAPIALTGASPASSGEVAGASEQAAAVEVEPLTRSGRPRRKAVDAAQERQKAKAAAEAAAKAAIKEAAQAGAKRRGRPASKAPAKAVEPDSGADKATRAKRPRAEKLQDVLGATGASVSGASNEEDDFVVDGAVPAAAVEKGKGKAKLQAPKGKRAAVQKERAGASKAATGKAGKAKDDDQPIVVFEKRGIPLPETIKNCSWQFGLPVNEQPDDAADKCKDVSNAIKEFHQLFREAQITEKERYDAAGGRHPNGKKMSKRPDLVALSKMRTGGGFINKGTYFGNVPGIPVNARFYSRTECVVVGLHGVHMKGIDYIAGPDVKKFLVANRKTLKLGPAREDSIPDGYTDPGNDDLGAIGLSVVVSGNYGDDKDDKDRIEYTGEGGNDYLGNKKQIGDQSLSRGNQALANNHKYGIPIRVVRKNEDEHAYYSVSYIYDGLYDVTNHWDEKGKDGYTVWKYDLHRRQGQPEPLSRQVNFRSVRNAPPKMDPRTRPGIIFTDLSRGKENTIIPVVNEAAPSDPNHGKLPPGIHPVDDKDNDLLVDKSRAYKKDPLDFEYVTEYVYGEGVPRPEPAKVPEQLRGLDPHEILAAINHDELPYLQIEGRSGKNSTAKKSKKEISILTKIRSIIWECGDWTGCKLGDACPQRVVQKGMQYRLEVFHTGNRGWGVRTWDFIPESAFVCAFWGELNPIEETAEDTYLFTCGKRPDYDYNGHFIPEINRCDDDDLAEYQVDARCKGNVARFINHSCWPNTFAQPVCINTLDESYCIVCFFASTNIDPWSEITYDYGKSYVDINLKGKCMCGSPHCGYERPEAGIGNSLRGWVPHRVMERNKQRKALEAKAARAAAAAAAAASTSQVNAAGEGSAIPRDGDKEGQTTAGVSAKQQSVGVEVETHIEGLELEGAGGQAEAATLEEQPHDEDEDDEVEDEEDVVDVD